MRFVTFVPIDPASDSTRDSLKHLPRHDEGVSVRAIP
jgi:hypothetical protein